VIPESATCWRAMQIWIGVYIDTGIWWRMLLPG
jgi:hypothetical protein